MTIIGSFSPSIEQLSIDEAFLDITGTGRLWGTPYETARAITKQIFDKRQLTVSIGIAPNKFLAKIASDMNKPNGITMTPFDEKEIVPWLAKLPVGRLMGVGKKTQELFFAQSVRTIGDVQKWSQEHLRATLGKHGEELFFLCRGIDAREVAENAETLSVSREYTYNEDTDSEIAWKKTLLTLSRDVARKLRAMNQTASVVVLIYRGHDFTKHSRRKTLPGPTALAKNIYDEALGLLSQAGIFGKKLRLIGVGATGLGSDVQTNLFSKASAWEAPERAMDALAQKFGTHIVMRGGEMQK
jgi:nucleotidyltransferase/DNA polymerase involved in DNA repair